MNTASQNTASPEPLAYSIADTVRVSSIGKTKLYALIKAGKLQARRIGGRTLIPAASLRALIDGEA
jgi:excisionase family DNA binding protein